MIGLLLKKVKKHYTTKQNKNMSTHMAHVEYEIAQLTIAQTKIWNTEKHSIND